MANSKNKFPTAVAVQYKRRIQKLIDENRKRTWDAWKNRIKPIMKEYKKRVGDSPSFIADDELDEAQQIIDELKQKSQDQVFTEAILTKITKDFLDGINKKSKKDLKEQFQKVKGIDPVANDKWLKSFMDSAVKENVDQIKSIDAKYHANIQSSIMQGVRRGKSINEIASEIKGVSDSSMNRAKFIARDQTGSVLGDMNKRRQESAGVERFVWVTSHDERVRDEHQARDGKIYTWKDGADGEFPGTPYNCRCVARPVEEDLFDFD